MDVSQEQCVRFIPQGQTTKVPVSRAGSTGRCNTLLVDWFCNVFQRGPISRARFEQYSEPARSAVFADNELY